MRLHLTVDPAPMFQRAPARWVGFALAALAVLALPGCKRLAKNDCNKPQGYEQSQSVAPLRTPVGLDALNTRAALKIPDLREPEAPPRKLTDACLDAPPKYSNAPLLPPAKDKKAEKAKKKLEKAKKGEAVVPPVVNPGT